MLDPFCGCGTTVHVAEELNRRWVVIDISKFSTGLIKERLVNNFQHRINVADIEIRATPNNLAEAQALADKDKFEFEKWVCGEIGAHGMFHDLGEKGADGGVDGVIEFGLFEGWEKAVALVPELWYLEALNALLCAERKGKITTTAQTKAFTSQLENLPITVDSSMWRQSFGQTMDLARVYSLSSMTRHI